MAQTQAGVRGSTALDRALRWRGVVFNALFVLYVAGIQPVLLARLLRSQELARPDGLLALVVLLAQVAEWVGYRLKWPMLKVNIRRWPARSGLGLAINILTVISHITLNTFLLVSVAPVFGISLPGSGFWSGLLALVILLAVIMKDTVLVAVYITRLYAMPSPDNAPNRAVQAWLDPIFGPDREPADPEAPAARLGEALGELLLIAYGATALTFTWDAIMGVIRPIPSSGRFMSFLGLTLVFLVIYAPSRMVFIGESWCVRQTPFRRALAVGTFVLVLALALAQVPVR